MAEDNKNVWKDREIGAFWKRQSSSQSFLSGKIEIEGKKLEVVLFSNRYKEKDNQPDYRLYISPEPKSFSLEENAKENAKEDVKEDVKEELV